MRDLTKSATESVYEQAVKDLEGAPMPDATEKVRQLLDEFGIEWSSPELSPNQTRFPNVKFEPWGVGTLKVTLFNLTPEQAIAVTQGGRKCESCSTRYQQLLGTPEKAAQTIADACGESEYCGGCPAFNVYCQNGDYDVLLEWLKSDVE